MAGLKVSRYGDFSVMRRIHFPLNLVKIPWNNIRGLTFIFPAAKMTPSFFARVPWRPEIINKAYFGFHWGIFNKVSVENTLKEANNLLHWHTLLNRYIMIFESLLVGVVQVYSTCDSRARFNQLFHAHIVTKHIQNAL